MNDPLRLLGWRRGDSPEALVSREWLATNGLGGYASSTIAGIATRRYHGKLIAALPAPLGRIVMLNHLEELVRTSSATHRLSGDEPKTGELHLPDISLLETFALERGLPVWTFTNGDQLRIEKRLVMPYLQNTTLIQYHVLVADGPFELHLRPSMHFRMHEEDVASSRVEPYPYDVTDCRLEIHGPGELRLRLGFDGTFERDERIIPELLYRVERSRGYRSEGVLWTPGSFVATLRQGDTVTLSVSTEPWAAIDSLKSGEAFELENQRLATLLTTARVAGTEDRTVAHLVLAADQFIISPQMRAADAARRRAAGDEARTVIAGYHWFTDWGRDTMISLEGLTLATGRYREAGGILRTFAGHIRDGLIPNMFPEGQNEGLYHTADATLWFFHAVHRYVRISGDRTTLRQLLPALDDIIAHHIRGTRFGIAVDPADGLLRQGEEGYQLTWMDAKVDGWVVTPRRGKAVEINALFYNALRLLAAWMREEGNVARALELDEHARRMRVSFNERFWFAEGRYLYDVVDAEKGGNDAALRPNQIFSVSLDHPVLDQAKWLDVVSAVERELLTPVGLRSLSPRHPDYKRTYDGDLRTRDAAYHQGTVWPWLIGPFFDAWRRAHPGREAEAKQFLSGLTDRLCDAGIGSIAEIFDAEEPYRARGCIAQAWSVAEVLRCLRAGGA